VEIRRYHIGVIGSVTPDDEMGRWCRYEDVEPLLERINELKSYYNGDVKLLLERIKELEEQLEKDKI